MVHSITSNRGDTLIVYSTHLFAITDAHLLLPSRPGLVEFLRNLKQKYEMHVYTMGTRAYAFEVCKAIDPDQSIFGDRVLTRDESGSK